MPYSRDFNHNNDMTASLIPGEVCKTTFIKEKIEYLIEPDGIEKIHIGVTKLPDNSICFTMKALDEENNILRAIIGDYPCPEECVPPESLVEAFINASGNNLFDLDDIEDVLAYNDITYLVVHKALLDFSSSPIVSHAIYPLTGNWSPTNPNSTTPHKSPGDPISISVVHL